MSKNTDLGAYTGEGGLSGATGSRPRGRPPVDGLTDGPTDGLMPCQYADAAGMNALTGPQLTQPPPGTTAGHPDQLHYCREATVQRTSMTLRHSNGGIFHDCYGPATLRSQNSARQPLAPPGLSGSAHTSALLPFHPSTCPPKASAPAQRPCGLTPSPRPPKRRVEDAGSGAARPVEPEKRPRLKGPTPAREPPPPTTEESRWFAELSSLRSVLQGLTDQLQMQSTLVGPATTGAHFQSPPSGYGPIAWATEVEVYEQTVVGSDVAQGNLLGQGPSLYTDPGCDGLHPASAGAEQMLQRVGTSMATDYTTQAQAASGLEAVVDALQKFLELLR